MWRSYLLHGDLFIRLLRQVKWKVAQEHCTYTIWHPITSVAQHICINSSAESSVRAPIDPHIEYWFSWEKSSNSHLCANVLVSNESIRKPKTQLVSTCSDWHIRTRSLSSTQTFQTRMCFWKTSTSHLTQVYPIPIFFMKLGRHQEEKMGISMFNVFPREIPNSLSVLYNMESIY